MTAAYDRQAAAFGRQVQYVVEMDLDRCSLEHGVSPCGAPAAADGSRCFYTFPSCQSPATFQRETRTLRFALNEIPWTDSANPAFPLLSGFVSVPQTVDPDSLTVYPEKITVTFLPDWGPLPLDRDKAAVNSARNGEFWRCLFVRNRNYSGRALRIKRGFCAAGFALADFAQIGPDFKITHIDVSDKQVKVTAESALADLSKIELPWTVSETNLLQADVAASATTLTVDDGEEFPDPAAITRTGVYLSCGAEFMRLTAVVGNVLTVARGALGTAATTHAKGDRVEHVLAFGEPGAPRCVTDAILDLLEWAKIPAASINADSFAHVKRFYWPSADVYALVRRPIKAAEIMAKLREPRLLMLFLDRAGLWTLTICGPVEVGGTLADEQLVKDTVSLSEDMDSRITRATFWYDPDVTEASSGNEKFHRCVCAIDGTAEQPNNYGDQRSKTYTDAFMWPDCPTAAVHNVARRLITRLRNGLRSILFACDLKDAGNWAIGDAVGVTTVDGLGLDGLPEQRTYLLTSREEKTETTVLFGGTDISLFGKFLHVVPDSWTDDYDSASADEKNRGGYWGDDSNRVGAALETGYVVW